MYEREYKIGQTAQYQDAVYTYDPCSFSHYEIKVGYIWHINICEADQDDVNISYKVSKDNRKYGWEEVWERNILEIIE